MTNSNSGAQNTECHKQRNRRWSYLLKAGGLWAQQNLSWTWSNREPQTMPIVIAAFYPAVTFIHHPQPEESCKISPLSERLMVNLAPFFFIHPPTHFCLVNTNHAASLSPGPPSLLLRLLWATKLSSVLSGSPDHGEMERCQLLTIPRISVWPLVPDSQCGGSLSFILKWPFCLRKHRFKSSV